MVIDIRGTHGSGKSYIVHTLLENYKHFPIIEDGEHLGYHLPKLDAAILGKYDNKCGGCDGIKTADEVCRRVRKFSKKYRVVILEGILVAHTFKRYSNLAKELDNYNFCFLNTPLNVCIRRVRQRRLEKGNMKEFNPKNVVKDWHSIWKRVKGKCEESGHNAVEIEYTESYEHIKRIITS